MNNIESAKGEIVMYQPDETIRLEVRVENETVWLTQQQMAELFQTTRNNITLHIGNIFKEGELDDSIVRKESLLTAADGKKYKTKLYNLDVIISVGYRVKSIRGTKFRQWANSVLKQYLLKGYAVNQRIFDIIVLVDNYINVDTLTMLSNRDTSVSATIYTRQLSQQQQLDVQRHNQQYPPITINTCLHRSALPLATNGTQESRPLPDCRRCGLSVWCQPEGCRQETLCLHPNARDIACRSSELDKIKTIREYGHNVLFH